MSSDGNFTLNLVAVILAIVVYYGRRAKVTNRLSGRVETK